MPRDLLVELIHSLFQLQQRLSVALFQDLHAPGELLRSSFHLALDGGIQSGEPLVLHHQPLDFRLGELGILGV